MLETARVEKIYVAPNGVKVKVKGFHQCWEHPESRTVSYTNLEAFDGHPIGTQWALDESVFLKTFREPVVADGERVAFLDFDGVFTLTYGRVAGTEKYVKAGAVALIDAAFQELGIKIVVSSSWRIGEDHLRLSTYLDLAGFVTNLHDDFKTKSLDGFRGNEVAEWLSRHPEVKEWVIIDDESDFHQDQLDRLVHCDYVEGFSARDYLRLRSVFGCKQDDAFLRPFKPKGVCRELPNSVSTKGEA